MTHMSGFRGPAARAPAPAFRASLWRTGLVALALVGWEVLSRLGVLDPAFVSSPAGILHSLVSLAGEAPVRHAFALTAFETLAAFAVAAAAGVLGGLAIGMSRPATEVGLPILSMLFAVPQMVLFPLFVLFLGIGIQSKIVFGVTHGTLPILLNTIAGVRTVTPALLEPMRAMGASRVQQFRLVYFPAAAPLLLTGLRMGIGHTLLGVLLAELFASQSGVGFYIRQYTAGLQAGPMLAMVLTISLAAIAVNEGMRQLELHVSRWRGR